MTPDQQTRGGDARLPVTVAAVGPSFGYPQFAVFGGDPFADQGAELGYEQRRRVVVDVSPSMTLGEVIDRAAEAFDVTSLNERTIGDQVSAIAWFEEGDESELAGEHWSRWYRELRIVDKAGHLSWAVHWADVTVAEALAIVAAGHKAGDPLRLYFLPSIPQGDLQTAAQALWTAWLAWETHGIAVVGTGGMLKLVYDRVKRARKVASGDHRAFDDALRRPQDLVAYLNAETRTTSKAAAFAGLPTDGVIGALQGMGYALGVDGRWRAGGDGPAEILLQTLRQIQSDGGSQTLEDHARRIQRLIEEASGGQ